MPHRCYLPDLPEEARSAVITGDKAHHLIKVLRCHSGEGIELFDGVGKICRGEISDVDRKTVQVKITERQTVGAPLKSFTLIQAVPKGKRQDIVLQKAVELGVRRVVFVQTDNVVSRMNPVEHASKLQRWNQVMIEALKQSGNPFLPTMELEFDWAKVVRQAVEDHEVSFLADLAPGTLPLKDILPEHREKNSFACCIGPEGDFTPEEKEMAHRAGCIPVNLGSRVLRTETAALFVMSVFAYEFLN